MADKSPDAFRTIREVADWLGVPTHVLRFWESKFSDVTPVKAAGGRRYYRREDILLLGGIKVLLHEQGLTIKGTQKMIEESGVEAVAAFSAEPNFDMPATQTRTRRIIRHGGEETEVPTFSGEKGGLYALEELEETVPEPQEPAEVIPFDAGTSSEPEVTETTEAVEEPIQPKPQPTARSAAELITPLRARLKDAPPVTDAMKRAELKDVHRKIAALTERLREEYAP